MPPGSIEEERIFSNVKWIFGVYSGATSVKTAAKLLRIQRNSPKEQSKKFIQRCVDRYFDIHSPI